MKIWFTRKTTSRYTLICTLIKYCDHLKCVRNNRIWILLWSNVAFCQSGKWKPPVYVCVGPSKRLLFLTKLALSIWPQPNNKFGDLRNPIENSFKIMKFTSTEDESSFSSFPSSPWFVNSFESVVFSDVVKVVVSDVIAASTDSVEEFSSSFVALSSSTSHLTVDVLSVAFAVTGGVGFVLAIWNTRYS